MSHNAHVRRKSARLRRKCAHVRRKCARVRRISHFAANHLCGRGGVSQGCSVYLYETPLRLTTHTTNKKTFGRATRGAGCRARAARPPARAAPSPVHAAPRPRRHPSPPVRAGGGAPTPASPPRRARAGRAGRGGAPPVKATTRVSCWKAQRVLSRARQVPAPYRAEGRGGSATRCGPGARAAARVRHQGVVLEMGRSASGSSRNAGWGRRRGRWRPPRVGRCGGGGHTRKDAALRPASRCLRVGHGMPAAPARSSGGTWVADTRPTCGGVCAAGGRGGRERLLLSSIVPVSVNSRPRHGALPSAARLIALPRWRPSAAHTGLMGNWS